jgi:polyketide biosynthesis enoyl-CoA hydratase PksI
MDLTGLVRTVRDAGSGVVRITMADPATGNALSEEMVLGLRAAFENAIRDQDARVVVLSGEGEMFSSGAPGELLARLARREVKPTEIWLPRVLLDCPLPVIAAMAGHAIGGGFALGLAADLVLLGRESRFGFTFMNMGFTPGMGTTRLAEYALPAAAAHELLYTGELRKGIGFAGSPGVAAVLPKSEVSARALDLAARIAEKPRRAIELLKRTLSLPRRRAFEEALTLESLMHEVTLTARVDAMEAAAPLMDPPHCPAHPDRRAPVQGRQDHSHVE